MGFPMQAGDVKPCILREKLWGSSSVLVGHRSALGGVDGVMCPSLPNLFPRGTSFSHSADAKQPLGY